MNLSLHVIQRRPYWAILAVFACWKLILGLITFTTPSPAYDTSTSLLLLQSNHANGSAFGIRVLKTICSSLARWDAIYFAKIAEPGRGYLNEQEWAFGWGYTQVIAATRRGRSMLDGGSGSTMLTSWISALLFAPTRRARPSVSRDN